MINTLISYLLQLDSLNNLQTEWEGLTYDPTIVQTYLNGTASEAMPMMKLMMQVVAILFVGIFLWRISAVFSRKQKNRKQDIFRNTRFQKHWRKN